MAESIKAANGRRVVLERRALPARPVVEEQAQPARAFSARLRMILGCARRLIPLNGDPERFHVDKSEICRDLETLADEMERAERGPAQNGKRR